MKVRGLKRSDAVDRTLWRLGCRNRPTPACGDNKPGSRQIMTGEKWRRRNVHQLFIWTHLQVFQTLNFT